MTVYICGGRQAVRVDADRYQHARAAGDDLAAPRECRCGPRPLHRPVATAGTGRAIASAMLATRNKCSAETVGLAMLLLLLERTGT